MAKTQTSDRSAAIAASWGDKSIRKARCERTSVKAKGEVYRSVAEAFRALKLPMGSHIRFRMALKASGREVFETEKGEKITFTVVSTEAPAKAAPAKKAPAKKAAKKAAKK